MNRLRRYSAESQPKAWLFLAPALLIIIVFNIYPLFRSFWMSFQGGTLTNPVFNGINNYKTILADANFHKAMKNTALYAFSVVPISLIISMTIAWIIFEKVKHKNFFETTFFIPYVTSTLAIGIVFKYFFNGSYGIINHILGWCGVAPINWLDSISMNMPTLIIFGIWSGLAFNIIILLAGFRNIDKQYYKVADMFGATEMEQFTRITLPQLFPTVTFLLTVNFISAFKVYTQVYALFGGKPGIANSAQTAVYYIYDKFHIAQRPGVGMAATVVLFLLILLFTFIQNKITEKVAH
ncbi:MAG: sugar ABC transporter permease [Erysipelothrix sp.]|nr:sugar ABC transporter permease [Erysipelothrix sp.]